MKKIKIILGISWATLCLVLIIILFPGLNSFSGKVAGLPFMKINPNMTGGAPAREIVSANCTIVVRKPVFDGLIGERKKGFVQIDWRGELPQVLNDTIDYNSDGINDFTVNIIRETGATVLNPLSDKVEGTSVSTPTSYGWCLRAKLKK